MCFFKRDPCQGIIKIFILEGRHATTCPPNPQSLGLLFWNLQGLGDNDIVQAFQNLMQKWDCHCVFLMDTKGSKDRMGKLFRSLGFSNFEIIDARGLAGGLLLMRRADVDLSVIWSIDQVIFCDFNSNSLENR